MDALPALLLVRAGQRKAAVERREGVEKQKEREVFHRTVWECPQKPQVSGLLSEKKHRHNLRRGQELSSGQGPVALIFLKSC